MRSNLWWVASAILLASVKAKVLKWADDSPSWVPPRETGEPKQIGIVPAAPEPTYMPTPNFDLLKRQSGGNNTCGYIGGKVVSESAVMCNAGWDCYPDQRLGVMGCCSKGNNCAVITRCWNSDQSKSYSGDGGGRIRLCSNSKAPYCAKGIFTGSSYSGYELLFCDASSSRTYSLSYLPPQAITKPSSSSSSSSKRSTRSTSPTTPTTTPTPSQTPAPAPTSSPSSAGAIAGGVVGGIAAVGLIVLGFIFLWRRKSQDDQPPPGAIVPGSTAYAAVSQYPPPQETAMGHERASLIKPPYRGSGSVSPYDHSLAGSALGSPSLGYQQPHSGLESPQPPYTPYVQPANLQSQPYRPQQFQPQPYQPQPYQPQQPVAHELPVGRSDGQLRELA